MAGQGTPVPDGRRDQALAGASAEIGLLVDTLTAMAADVGAEQAAVDVGYLLAGKGAPELAGLLTAALCRLAGWRPRWGIGMPGLADSASWRGLRSETTGMPTH